MNEDEIIEAHCPECFQESSYKTLNKTLSVECIKDRIQKCFEILMDLWQKEEANGGISSEIFNSLCLKLVETVERSIGFSLPPSTKTTYFKSKLLPLLITMIDQINLPLIFDTVIQPFLAISRKDSSFTLSVGPGSEINQMIPHDKEFFDAVFEKYKRNVLMVFEGGSEGDFGEKYKEIFEMKDKDELLANEWFASFISYLSELFGVDPNSIVIESPSSVLKLVTIKYGNNEKITKIILYLGDYLAPLVEPSLQLVIPAVSSRNLICGIRSGTCNDIFFRDSELFYSGFNYYVFTHEDRRVTDLKNTTQSIRINLKRIRNTGQEKTNFLESISKNRNNRDVLGYPTSKLCNRNQRQPANEPYCVQGRENRNIFWRGLGGKKRSTKRHSRKGRKTRKH